MKEHNMADEATKDAAVVGGAYKESDSHVPNPTDLYGTFNTSGTGAHHDPATVSPIFDVDRQATAQQIVAALDPEDDSVPASAVLLSGPQVATVTPDHEAEANDLLEKAKARLADGPVEVGGETHLDEEAAREGDEGARAASAQEAATAGETSVTAGSHGTEMTGTVDTTGTGGPTDAGQVSNVPAADDQTVGDGEAEADEAPAKSANKAEWVDYAVKKGANREEAEGKTVKALQEEYGA